MPGGAKILLGAALGAVALGAAYQLKPEWFGLTRAKAPEPPAPKPATPAKPAALPHAKDVGNPRAGHDDAKDSKGKGPLAHVPKIPAIPGVSAPANATAQALGGAASAAGSAAGQALGGAAGDAASSAAGAVGDAIGSL